MVVSNVEKSQVTCRIGVIADDLTGANDAGVQFRKAELSTTVVIDRDTLPDVIAKTDVVVVNTDSRHLSPQGAYQESKSAAQTLGKHGVEYIYKKVDSMLRGNAGAELDGIMDALDLSVCMLAPSFPANARTTVHGQQLVDGTPLEATEASTDILAPTRSSYIPEVIAKQSRRNICVIGLDIVRLGPDAIAEHAHNLVESGYSMLVVDAVEQRDLSSIAHAAALLGVSHMTAGSAGLAAELSAAYGIVGSAPPVLTSRQPSGVLALVGSATHVSAQQVLRAIQEPGIHGLKLDPGVLEDQHAREDHISRLVEESCKHLANAEDVIISVVRKASAGDIREQALRIKDTLTRIATAVVCRRMVRGIAVTGGDTAEAVFRALKVSGISLQSEVLPGLPYGRLVGGFAHGMPIITKSGSFGETDALLATIRHLKNQ